MASVFTPEGQRCWEECRLEFYERLISPFRYNRGLSKYSPYELCLFPDQTVNTIRELLELDNIDPKSVDKHWWVVELFRDKMGYFVQTKSGRGLDLPAIFLENLRIMRRILTAQSPYRAFTSLGQPKVARLHNELKSSFAYMCGPDEVPRGKDLEPPTRVMIALAISCELTGAISVNGLGGGGELMLTLLHVREALALVFSLFDTFYRIAGSEEFRNRSRVRDRLTWPDKPIWNGLLSLDTNDVVIPKPESHTDGQLDGVNDA